MPSDLLGGRSFGTQLSALALVFGPLGGIVGYVLAPQVALAPVHGAVVGLVVGTIPLIAWLSRYADGMK